MRTSLLILLTSAFALMSTAQAQTLKPTKADIPYVAGGHERQVLDVYAPQGAKGAPVLFWIHGGGWQTGDKANVDVKPDYFVKQHGMLFVSINYRLWPKVEMEALIGDVAKAFRWVQEHISEYGGDPARVIVGGHSAGAQLAAIICTDEKYLKAEGITNFAMLKGCLPVDGDTYDIPAMIETAEGRLRAHGYPMPTTGHRQKFGNDPAKHKDFSAVYHVEKGKGIPPFLIVYVSHHPDNSMQARRFSEVLKAADVPVTLYGGKNTHHVKINDDIGVEGDAGTEAVAKFVAECLKQREK
jgi:acetyl esterase/lipase